MSAQRVATQVTSGDNLSTSSEGGGCVPFALLGIRQAAVTRDAAAVRAACAHVTAHLCSPGKWAAARWWAVLGSSSNSSAPPSIAAPDALSARERKTRKEQCCRRAPATSSGGAPGRRVRVRLDRVGAEGPAARRSASSACLLHRHDVSPPTRRRPDAPWLPRRQVLRRRRTGRMPRGSRRSPYRSRG